MRDEKKNEEQRGKRGRRRKKKKKRKKEEWGREKTFSDYERARERKPKSTKIFKHKMSKLNNFKLQILNFSFLSLSLSISFLLNPLLSFTLEILSFEL